MAVEYVLAFTPTVFFSVSFGMTIAPAVADYRKALHEDLLENRALIQELENVCQAPVTQ